MSLRDKRVLQLRILAFLAENCTFPGEQIEGLSEGFNTFTICTSLSADRGEVIDNLREMAEQGLIQRMIVVDPTGNKILWRPRWSFERNLCVGNTIQILP